MAAVTNNHPFEGLKQHGFISHNSGGQMSEASLTGIKPVSPGILGENPLLCVAPSGDRQHSLAYMYISSISALVFTLVSPLIVCLTSLCLSLIDMKFT